MSDDTISTLVPSSNRGRYALDDPEHGHDLTSSEPIAILLGGQWIEGHIEHSGHYSGPGCYHIADSGRKDSQRPDTPKTQEECERTVTPRVRAAIQEGMSLADAMSATTGQVVDLFCGYYFIADLDGAVCGLCTGMQVRLISARRNA
jgi:Domain of unknown function (DUF5348)